MTRQTIQHSVTIHLTSVALLIVSSALVGSPPQSPPAEKESKAAPEAKKNAEEQIRREAEDVIRTIDLEVLSEDKWTKVERIEKPLLFYSDPTRHDDRGSVWGWGRKGRPLALIEFYRGATYRTGWTFAICNTSGRKLRARRAGAPWWHENDSAAELKEVPGASAPAAEVQLRQRQLKLLAQRFTAHEIFGEKFDLRLLQRPLYTYRDEAAGVLDGGLFTLAHGTNPEIMLFVEAHVDPKDNSKRIWQFTVGRSANAELHLEYNGKEVFEAPPANRVSASDKPYWFGYINAALDAEPGKP